MNYLTVQEVAEMLRVHTNTIYKMCRTQRLPAVKFGKEWRIDQNKIDGFLDAQTLSSDNIKAPTKNSNDSNHILGIFSDELELTQFELNLFLSAVGGTRRLLKGCWWQNPDDFRQALHKIGLRVSHMEAEGRLVIVDLKKINQKQGPSAAANAWLTETKRSIELGYEGLIGSGSPNFSCCGTLKRLLQFESTMHRILKGFPITAMCVYILEKNKHSNLSELIDLIMCHDRVFFRSSGKKIEGQFYYDKP